MKEERIGSLEAVREVVNLFGSKGWGQCCQVRYGSGVTNYEQDRRPTKTPTEYAKTEEIHHHAEITLKSHHTPYQNWQSQRLSAG